jgi:hypothetical protein
MTSTLKAAVSAAALISSLTLASCAMDDGYGYGGVDVGYGSPYYGYGYAPYGWYDGYYYPGNGYWLYDRGGNRHRWNDRHQRYWEGRREHTRDWRGPSTQPWQPGLRDNDRPRRDWSGGQRDGVRQRVQQRRPDNGGARQAPQVQQRSRVDAPAPPPANAPQERRGRVRSDR